MPKNDSKVVVGVRVHEHVKDALKEKAELVGESPSAYTAKLLTQHVENPNNEFVTVPHLQDYQDKIDDQNERIEDFMETINALEEELQTLRLSKGEEVEGLSLKYNQLNEAFEQQRNYSKQLEEQLQDQQQQIASAPLVRVNDQDRFDQQLMTLQQSFPSLTVNQVLELVVSCALHNEHSFFVHSLKEHTKRNPNFFTSKLPNHETSSF